MSESTQTLSANASFESVMAATQELLSQMAAGKFDAVDVQAQVIHLLSLDKGPRGFFASLLTDSREVVDHPPDSLLAAFQQVPDVTAELLTKNLAMSSAMVVYHQRQQDEEAAAGSQQVQQRCVQFITQLQSANLQDELNELFRSVKDGGSYGTFLQRWNYDDEQRAAIGDIAHHCLQAIAA